MKEKLTYEKSIELGLTWIGCVKYYKPELTDGEADYILWEFTCFPFDTDTALSQIYDFFLNKEPNDELSVARNDARELNAG